MIFVVKISFLMHMKYLRYYVHICTRNNENNCTFLGFSQSVPILTGLSLAVADVTVT